jgi:flagellar assembly protein FliH
VRTFARIVPAGAAARGAPLFPALVSDERRRRVTREELEGRRIATQVVERARAEAHALLERAAIEAKAVAHEAGREAEAEARAREAARWIALRSAEQSRLEDDRDRWVAVAVALAERLLGASLELDPARISSLVQAVLAEARGARRVTIEAHPLDASALREHLAAASVEPCSVDVREGVGLARGDLLLHTDVGTIDARLTLRFERLAAALRDAVG